MHQNDAPNMMKAQMIVTAMLWRYFHYKACRQLTDTDDGARSGQNKSDRSFEHCRHSTSVNACLVCFSPETNSVKRDKCKRV